MDDRALLNDVLLELKCIHCLELIKGQIFQISSGFAYCAVCIVEIEDDPSAIALRPFTRNLSLEKIAQVIKRQCTHVQNGCTFIGFYTQIKKHKTTCTFRPRICPTMWTINNECSWRGTGKEMKEHFKKDHPEITWCEILPPLYKVEGFRNGQLPNADFMHTFIAHDELFMFILLVEVKTKLFWVGCYYFIDIPDKFRFNFNVSIIDPRNNSRGPTFGCVCAYKAEDTAEFTYFIPNDYSQWMKLCDENGALHYTVVVNDSHAGVDNNSN